MNLCRGRWRAIGMAVATVLFAPEAFAQGSFILPSTRVIMAGPVSLYPQIGLRETGTDSNVYLDSTSPRSDLTYSLTPRLYAVVPIGNTRFIGTGTGDLVYFQTYSDQRSLTLVLDGRYEVTSPGFRPFVEMAFASRGERVGFEIDARARHTQSNLLAGIDVDVTPITALTAWVGHSATAYDEDDEYLSFLLADQLNHTRDTAAAGARFRVTPLTTVLVAAEFERDRFELAPLRNADSFRIAPAIALDTGAAITGNAKAGFRSFTPRHPEVPSFRGFVGSARLHYALPDIIRLDLEADRDLSYSYDPIQPYYMEAGVRLTATQRVLRPDRNHRNWRTARDSQPANRRPVVRWPSGGDDLTGRRRGHSDEQANAVCLDLRADGTCLDRAGGPQLRAHSRARFNQLRTLNCEKPPPACSRSGSRSGILER